jgi:riboflavin kinase/FMN adenylyltransferase
MKTIYFPDESYFDGSCMATIGFFDGVHRGHRFLLEHLRATACEHGLLSMAVTFERHPRQVVQQGWQPELLTTLDEKIRLMESAGIDILVVLRFDVGMAALSAYDFMAMMRRQLGVRCLLTGYDNRFGHGRAEGFLDYQRYGMQLGMLVMCGDALRVGAESVSSSRIRRLLKEGNVAEACQCLGRPYAIGGQVVHGEQIGRTIGFPTANVEPDACKLIPEDGVYAVLVDMEGKADCRGVMNIGSRPTFHGDRRTLEVNILDETGDFYGQRVTVRFLARLRGELSFPSGEALALQIGEDKRQAEKILNAYEL